MERPLPGERRTDPTDPAVLAAAAVLGVPPDADPGLVRQAFAQRARALHPDTASGLAAPAEELARVIAARDTLLGARAGPARPVAPARAPRTPPGPLPVSARLRRALWRFLATWQSYDRTGAGRSAGGPPPS